MTTAHPYGTLKRVKPGRYVTDDGLYEVARWSGRRFKGGRRWVTDHGWKVDRGPKAKMSTPISDLDREIFETKREAHDALMEFHDWLVAIAKGVVARHGHDLPGSR